MRFLANFVAGLFGAAFVIIGFYYLISDVESEEFKRTNVRVLIGLIVLTISFLVIWKSRVFEEHL